MMDVLLRCAKRARLVVAMMAVCFVGGIACRVENQRVYWVDKFAGRSGGSANGGGGVGRGQGEGGEVVAFMFHTLGVRARLE